MKFKDHVAQDNLKVFINMDEFGEPKFIDGEKYDVVIDYDLINERDRLYTVGRAGTDAAGVFQSAITFFIREADLGFIPDEGQPLFWGDSAHKSYPYIVAKVSSAMGILEITIEANES
ncbi:hypothetical protein [Paenibacillus sp. GCM10027626]|uniref:hypothetical protein n=1 Tax=Paenibacillus sp. GCM10027626 TaxID=3273411 RepID=UPI00362EEFD2